MSTHSDWLLVHIIGETEDAANHLIRLGSMLMYASELGLVAEGAELADLARDIAAVAARIKEGKS